MNEQRVHFRPHTEAFAKLFAAANEEQRTLLGSMHVHYEGEIRRMVANGDAPHNIAFTLNALVDEGVANTLAGKFGRGVRCTKGCAACCRIHVSVTREEAALLVGWAEDQGIEMDWPRLERQARHTLATWKDMPGKDRRCVFLGAGDVCTVYEHRPSACRKYLVMSNPENCDTIRHPGREVKVLAAPEAEAVTSAMLAVLPYASMAKMLIAAKKEASGGKGL